MDFTWTAPTTGDITGVTAGTGITGGGTSGDVTVSFDQANFGGGQFAAGKNHIINGDFAINQRSFTSRTTNGFGFDRFEYIYGDGTVTYSAQTFTAGAAPVTGYEAANFARIATVSQTAVGAYSIFQHKIEDVRNFAGQTATLSFWAKAGSGTPKVAFEIEQVFGSGGSPSGAVGTYVGQATLSTSWTRYSLTVSVPSISGKTIGTTANTSYLLLNLWTSAGSSFNSRTGSIGIQNATIDFWGVQMEAGSTATPFQTATGTIQGELSACMRYFYAVPNGNGKVISNAFAYAASEVDTVLNFPVQMRTTPTLGGTGGTNFFGFFRNGGEDDFDGFTLAGESTAGGAWIYNNAQISGTAGQAGLVRFKNAGASLTFSAEL